MKIELENCQKSLTLKDFEEIESKLGYGLCLAGKTERVLFTI